MKITAVMVTYNRLFDLKKSLETYEKQTARLETLIVVNNNSSDGTREFLNNWKKERCAFQKKVIHLKENLGGSGGFYKGIKAALQTDCEWIWIADDDAFLDDKTFENLEFFYEQNKIIMKDCVALCSSIIKDLDSMSIDIGHRRRIKNRLGIPKQNPIKELHYKEEYFPVDLFTFVGSLVRKSAIETVGLPHKDFFIYYDDIEFAYRVGRKGKMYCIPSSKVFHSAAKHEEEYGFSWRSYYQSRNMMIFYKEHFPVEYCRMVIKRVVQKMILMPIGKYTLVNQLDWDAMVDAIKGNYGISKKYYIGWNARKEN